MSRTKAGFTLLETLVALAILGVVMATVFGVFGSGLRAAHRDEDRLLLGLVAQNLLVRSRLDLNPRGGALSGDIGGGLRWRIESEPYEIPKDILPEKPKAEDDATASFLKEGKGAAEQETVGSAGLPARDARADQAERPAFGETAKGMDRRTGTSNAETAGALGEGDQREPAQPREPLRLRLVKVTVEKGDQRFELTGLAAEPRRERNAAR